MKNFEYQEVAPAIFVYDNVISNCEEIIQLGSEKAGWSSATVVRKDVGRQNAPYIVSDENVRVVDKVDVAPSLNEDVRWFLLAKKLWEYGDHYANSNDTGFGGFETPQLLHYNTSKGFYRPHSDAIPGANRNFSAVLYLNDVDEGGETYFERFNISVSPKSGRLAIFPANFPYIHEARQPISNDKFVIVTWFGE